MFIVALFTIAPKWKQLKCTLTDGQRKYTILFEEKLILKMNHLQTTDHNLEAKPHVTDAMRWCDVIPDEEQEFDFKMQRSWPALLKTSHFSFDYMI